MPRKYEMGLRINNEPNVISTSFEEDDSFICMGFENIDRDQGMEGRGKTDYPVIDSDMRDGDRQGVGDSAKRKVILEVEDKSFDNDVNGEAEGFGSMDRERHRLR